MTTGTRNLFIGLSLATLGAALGALYWVFTTPVPPPPPPEKAPKELSGLESLPEVSGLVAGVDLTAIREHSWFTALQAESPQEEDPDYREFVDSTGFDYTRDLDRLWVGVFGPSKEPFVAGLAEGRFSREKIIAHAEKYGGELEEYRGAEIYHIDQPLRMDDPALTENVRSFAFAFLSETRLAFGTDAERVRMVLDVIAGEAPSVTSDPERRARLEASAAASQLWVADDISRWTPPRFSSAGQTLQIIREFGAGMQVGEQDITIRISLICGNSEQAESLYTNLKLALLGARFFLGSPTDPLVHALGKLLNQIELYSAGTGVEAVLNLTSAQVSELLKAAEKSAEIETSR